MITADHNALTLQVAMKNLLLVKVAKCISQLLSHSENNVLRKCSNASLSLADLLADNCLTGARVLSGPDTQIL